MNNRLLWMGSALAVSAVVLLVALLWGGPRLAPDDGPPPVAPQIDGQGIARDDLEHPNRGIGTDRPIEVVRNFELFSETPQSLTRFSGDEVTPQADFIADVVRPVAEVRFSPQRVLKITAAAGRFHHPGNVPTRGEFHDSTVVTLYQAPDGQTVDPQTDRDVALRIYLDASTSFDRERGHVLSDGPVRVVGPEIDFTGRGLEIIFNSLADRIETLTITHGDQLRLARSARLAPDASNDDNAADPPSPAAGSAESPTPDASVRADADPSPANNTDPPAAAPPAVAERAAPPQQWYHAVLRDRVVVQVGQDEARLAGDRLEVDFPLDSDRAETAEAAAEQAARSPLHRPSRRVRMGSSTSPLSGPSFDADFFAYVVNTEPAGADVPEPDPRRLMTPHPDDIIVTWAGPLELRPVEPETETNAAPAADADGEAEPQTRFTLTGTPARVDTVGDEHIRAATVGYVRDRQLVFADGSDDHPLTITTPELGTLAGTRLRVDQASAQGQLLGPGTLQTPRDQLRIGFDQRLDLAFAPDAQGRLDQLRSATFRGNVQASARTTPPAEASDPSDPDPSDPPSTEPTQNLEITTPALTLYVSPDANGEPQPTRLEAAGNADSPVTASQPGTDFQAHQLTVDLSPAPPSPPSQTPTDDGGTASAAPDALVADDVQVSRLRALGEVRVHRPEEQLRLTAHALDADPRVNRLELFGRGDQTQAVLVRGEATLTGLHLILQEAEQSADAIGPGTLTARTDPDDPAARLDIAWTQAMTFRNADGTALFRGDVRAASTSRTDDSTLLAHSLALEFVPQALQDDAGLTPPSTDQTANPADAEPSDAASDASVLDLRRAHALADPETPDRPVRFAAQTFSPGADRTAPPLTRLTLEGGELLFVNQPPNLTNQTAIDDTLTIQQVRLPVRGRMLLEDYRQPEADDADASTPPPSPSNLNFAGRGATLFAWERSFILDAQANDLRLDGDVYMAHDPDPADPDPDQLIKLNAQRLVADLTETGGLGAFVEGSAPQAQIRQVNADGQVRLAQGTSNIVADHLEYRDATQQVLLWAEPRRETLLTLDGRALPAWGYRWDLPTDTFTALEPNGGVIPVE